MQKLFGAILIICGSTGLGLYYRDRYYTAIRYLQVMQQIVEAFMGEIRFGKATLPECCLTVGERTSQPFSQKLLEIHKRLTAGEGSFFELWKSCMSPFLKTLPLSEREAQIFLDLSDCVGLTENLSQVRRLEQCRDMLESVRAVREKALEKQVRMMLGMGVMSGLLLAVVLI